MLKFAKLLSSFLLAFVIVISTLTIFLVGFVKGYSVGTVATQRALENALSGVVTSTTIPNAKAIGTIMNAKSHKETITY